MQILDGAKAGSVIPDNRAYRVMLIFNNNNTAFKAHKSQSQDRPYLLGSGGVRPLPGKGWATNDAKK